MPKYRITAPDGKTFDVEGDGTAEEALAHVQSTYQAAPDNRPAYDATDQTAFSEAAANVGTGLVGGAAGGIAGILQGVKNVGADAINSVRPGTIEPGMAAADRVRQVQSALTYEPRTDRGRQMADVASYPFQKLAEGADYLGGKTAEATGSPALGAAVNTGVQALPALVLRGKVGNGRGVNGSGAPVAAGEAEAAGSVAAKAERAPGLAGVSEKPPSLEQLRADSAAAYKAADDAGVTISGNAISNLKTRVATDLKKEGVDPTLHPSTTAAMGRILESKGDLTLSEVETLRKISKDAEKSKEPADQRLAGKVVDHIDDFLEGLKPEDIKAGDAAGVESLQNARSLYSRMKKSEEVNDLFRRAEIKAGANYTSSGMENALRQEFKSLALNKSRIKRFNPEERAAIERVAKGAPLENFLRQAGKFSLNDRFGQIAALISTASTGFGGVALPVMGEASRFAATRMTLRNANAAEELMRRGPNKVPQAQKRNALITD